MKRASEYSKMAVSYRKLRHILIDRGMKKKDLEEAAGITHYHISKESLYCVRVFAERLV